MEEENKENQKTEDVAQYVEFDQPVSVIVKDFNISFANIVWIMVKVVIAMIPAMLILFVIGVVLAAMFPALRDGVWDMYNYIILILT